MREGVWAGVKKKIKDGSGRAPTDGRSDDQRRERERDGGRKRWQACREEFQSMAIKCDWTNACGHVLAERLRGDWT